MEEEMRGKENLLLIYMKLCRAPREMGRVKEGVAQKGGAGILVYGKFTDKNGEL